MNAFILRITVLLCTLGSSLGSEDGSDGLYTSNADLQDLLHTESELVRGMHNYIEEEERRLHKLKQ